MRRLKQDQRLSWGQIDTINQVLMGQRVICPIIYNPRVRDSIILNVESLRIHLPASYPICQIHVTLAEPERPARLPLPGFEQVLHSQFAVLQMQTFLVRLTSCVLFRLDNRQSVLINGICIKIFQSYPQIVVCQH